MRVHLLLSAVALTALLVAGCGEQIRFTPAADVPPGLPAVDEARVKIVSTKPDKGVEIGRATSTLNALWSGTARSWVVKELGSHGATFVVLTEAKRLNMGDVDEVTVDGIGYVVQP